MRRMATGSAGNRCLKQKFGGDLDGDFVETTTTRDAKKKLSVSQVGIFVFVFVLFDRAFEHVFFEGNPYN